MSKKPEGDDMRERLVAAALKLIEEQGGLRGVNLRQVAKAAGCAHTNVYNYYADFEALLWEVFDRIGELSLAYSAQRLPAGGGKADRAQQLFGVMIDFALEHPGWYRCLWSEPLSGRPPKKLIDNRRKQHDALAARLAEGQPNPLNPEQADRLFAILFSYVHGAILLMINGRIYRSDVQSYKLETLKNVHWLREALRNQDDFKPG